MDDTPSPTLAVTMGDPRGIGPDVIVEALLHVDFAGCPRLVIVGSRSVLEAAAASLDLPLATDTAYATLLDLDNFPADAVEPRRPDAASGRASLDYIERAVRMVLDGQADAVVTGPINKEAIAAAGSPYPGHTEMLAGLCGGGRSVMMLVSAPAPGTRRGHLRVAQVTTHLALRDVPGAVTAGGIVETARIVDDSLRRFFAIESPRIAVCGLNPHCSDGGRFGDEEERVVVPAVTEAQSAGIDLRGPKPADTVFVQALRGGYDAVLALYHDQGMIPAKMAGLDRVVNVTLGLPIIRTSVGHGTAYDIAGTGRADEGSLVEAIKLAARMAAQSARGDR